MTPALLVGSRPAWLAKLRPHLAGVGIDVRWTWEEPGAPRAGLPPGAALMLIATDCNSHALSENALRLARAHGLLAAHISHRWASAAPILARAGFPRPTTPDPEPTTPSLKSAMPSPPVKPNLSTPENFPLPPYPIKQHYAAHLPVFLTAIAEDPQLPVAILAERASVSRSYAAHIAPYARRTLGLRAYAALHPNHSLIEDHARYQAWCAHLRVHPWSPPVPVPVPVPVVAELTPPPPPPAREPAPKRTAAPEVPEDVRAACALLLDAMREHGFTRCALRADGSVEWDRTITTTGTTTL